MPNVNAPFGLKPLSRLDGGIVGRVNNYSIADAYASTIGFGDLVVLAGTFNSNTPYPSANIALGATTNTFRGVFAGCTYQDTLGNFIFSPKWVASTATLNAVGAQAYVYDDPQIIFKVQALLTSPTSAQLEGFAAINYVAPNSLGISQTTITGYQAGITDVKLLGLTQDPGNAIANYALVKVLIAKHSLRDPLSNN